MSRRRPDATLAALNQEIAQLESTLVTLHAVRARLSNAAVEANKLPAVARVHRKKADPQQALREKLAAV
jgi:hypothetical protein